MKYIILLISLVLVSCGPSKEEIEAWEKKKEDSIKKVQFDTQFNNTVAEVEKRVAEDPIQSNPHKTYNNNTDFYMGIYSVNGCEYISFGQGKGCCAVVHAGNCCNPIHHAVTTHTIQPDDTRPY